MRRFVPLLVYLSIAAALGTGVMPAQASPSVSGLTVVPTIVVGGDRPTGTVTLSAPAPTGGLNVRLASSHASAVVPQSVLVAAGQTSANFSVGTTPVTANATVILTATVPTGARTATFALDKAGTNPRVPQGGSASFRAAGGEAPVSGFTWDLTRAATVLATSARPNGWSVSYDTTAAAMTVSGPLSATIATGCKVRVAGAGRAYSALFDVVAASAGIPGNPLPAWAEDVRPTDSSPMAGGFGPSSADSVDLATGVYENRPDPDMVADNPVGPDAVYGRLYRSALAQQGYGSPGLSPGWVDNWDIVLQGSAGTWGALSLTYPNGAMEALTPVVAGSLPTGTFTLATGAPYRVTGAPGAGAGRWQWVRVTFGDLSTWTFLPDPRSPDRYLLRQISNLVGRSIYASYDTAGRLLSIADDGAPQTVLLRFAYAAGGQLQSVQDRFGRQVRYGFALQGGVSCLASVSQLAQSGASAASRWTYGYAVGGGAPSLISVGAPDANGAAKVVTHPVRYDAQNRVSDLTDANGNVRSFAFQPGSTKVTIRSPQQAANPSVPPTLAWTQKLDEQGRDTGTIDAAGHATSLLYQDPANPASVTQAANRNNQAVRATYDHWGNVLSAVDRRGVWTHLSYDYALSPTGRLTSIQVGSKTPTRFGYYPNGLPAWVDTPRPGTSGTGQTVRSSFAYTALGNLATVTHPGPDAAGTPVATTYGYTLDPLDGYSKAEALGQPVTASDELGHTVHYRWDLRGNLVAAIDAVGNRTDLVYSAQDRLLQVLYPATGQQHATGRGSLVYRYAYPDGPAVGASVYDEAGALVHQVSVTSGAEADPRKVLGSLLPATTGYDAAYRGATLDDGKSARSTWSFDSVSNLTAVRMPMGDTARVTGYDADGNPLAVLDGRARVTHYTRAADDSRVTGIAYASDPTHGVQLEHDEYGRTTRMQDGTGVVETTYDDLDNVVSSVTTYSGLAAKTVSYTYFPDGSRASMTGSCQ